MWLSFSDGSLPPFNKPDPLETVTLTHICSNNLPWYLYKPEKKERTLSMMSDSEVSVKSSKYGLESDLAWLEKIANWIFCTWAWFLQIHTHSTYIIGFRHLLGPMVIKLRLSKIKYYTLAEPGLKSSSIWSQSLCFSFWQYDTAIPPLTHVSYVPLEELFTPSLLHTHCNLFT